jgi:hypothetical protein
LSFEPVDSPLRRLPNTLEFLRTQVHTTFLPGNQPLPASGRLLLQGNKNLDVLHKGDKVTLIRSSNDQSEEQSGEPVLALTTPFEGGENYVLDAVRIVARDVGAELLRFDLAMGLGFHGSGAPLEDMGEIDSGDNAEDHRIYCSASSQLDQSNPATHHHLDAGPGSRDVSRSRSPHTRRPGGRTRRACPNGSSQHPNALDHPLAPAAFFNVVAHSSDIPHQRRLVGVLRTHRESRTL